MNRGGMSLALPPFTRVVKRLIIINTAVFVFMLLARNFFPSGTLLMQLGWLVPSQVLHGRIWELVTYSFFHVGLFHLLFNMLTLWMFGSQFESDWGSSRFLEFFFFCVAGAAVTTIVLGYMGAAFLGPVVDGGSASAGFMSRLASLVYTPTVGASGGIYGLLIAFGILYGDRQIFMFPFPFAIRAKYMVGIWIFIALVGALQDAGGAANFAHLGGALFGWLYLRFIPRRGLQTTASEGYFGIRNRYYRWKRRRAARKFEVYMRNQGQTPPDRSQYFDEYGNYKAPDPRAKGPYKTPGPRDKDNGPRSPWVN
jgi:membrane associated rhomboid family serine protease